MSHLLTCASLNCVVYREHDDHEFECRKPVAGQKYNHHHLLSFFANTTSVSMLSNERAVPNAPLATLVFHGVILDADHHIPLVVMPEVSFVRVHGSSSDSFGNGQTCLHSKPYTTEATAKPKYQLKL